MEGCLTTLVKLTILAGLFCFGLFMGYLYYQGAFDAHLVGYSFSHMTALTPDDAANRVDAKATVQQATVDPDRADRRWILWTGIYSDTRVLSPTLTQLTFRTATEPRLTFVAFYNGSLAALGLHVGDTVEILGQARKLWVASEDREGRRYPQVLAIRARKITPRPEEVVPSPEPVTRVTKEIKDRRP